MTTTDVNNKWVEVVTAARKCRLLELRELVELRDVAKPMVPRPLGKGNRISLLLSFVLDVFLAEASRDTAVWLDILAVNQHEETIAHKHDVAGFDAVVKACSGGTIVVMDVAKTNPASRGWCIYEWSCTLAVHGADGLHVSFPNASDRKAVVSTIDIRNAQCQLPRDKDMILRSVEERHGSPKAFDTSLKLQLLLEPLSYSMDLRRLLKRAKGTVWALGPVGSWLKQQQPGSSGRVLCIASGAGEGKSTISAVLCSEHEQLPPGSISAFHFLKYNDQRRLDPVRIVKSLAFQLASRFPAYAEAILALDVVAVAQLSDVEEAFVMLLLGPLQELAKHAEAQAQAQAQGQAQPPGPLPAQLVLLLDALDEADPLGEQLGEEGAKSQFPLPHVYGLYGTIFQSSLGAGDEGRVRDLIGVLQAAKEPLAQSFLAQLGLGDAVPLLPGSPTLFFVDTHRLYSVHKSLGDWLRDPSLSGAFAADVVKGHELLGRLLASTWRHSPARAYALKHALTHLGAAACTGVDQGGSDEAVKALDELLGDAEFLQAVAAAGCLPRALSALGSLPSHTKLSGDMLRWLRLEQGMLFPVDV
ncbi:hypothetical protein HYH03_011750 [Edaphochlamys debaryana]|uniref:Nephrocystin 3-like N-terminal domain-containing protein n=1 Tax=Edaphochlamys debaryana TaxID=47281 RepID=A0A835XWT4_9CHLO|nr:hypothetical protein HYH03_011750 [Edaphochlamys debaryana]|eukprot:KAG2489801.1 hypothetical protein HYH03_011750 [Edaphochlamys debaryana]